MAIAGFTQFFYRVNPDKTIDAICAHCFLASTSGSSQADLQAWQTVHRCANLLKQTA